MGAAKRDKERIDIRISFSIDVPPGTWLLSAVFRDGLSCARQATTLNFHGHK
jgi:hypothetical protein